MMHASSSLRAWESWQCHSNENPLIISIRKRRVVVHWAHPTCEFLNETPTQKKIICFMLYTLQLFFKSVVMPRCVALCFKVIRIVVQTLRCSLLENLKKNSSDFWPDLSPKHKLASNEKLVNDWSRNIKISPRLIERVTEYNLYPTK